MSAFFLAWLAVAACSIGARDQLLVARLAGQGRGPSALLTIALVAATISACIMGYAGSTLSALLPPAAKQMLIAFALIAAAVELFRPVLPSYPAEPTRSLFALSVVLVARQLGDAARFCVFAFAAASGSAPLATLGGALGSAAALALAVSVRDDLAAWPLVAIRRTLAAMIAIAAIYLALGARGLA